MKQVKEIFEAVAGRLEAMTLRNAVVAKPVSVGKRHVLTLCELSVGYGGLGGRGEGQEDGTGAGSGSGVGAGGKASACPVAVLVIDDGRVRLEQLGT